MTPNAAAGRQVEWAGGAVFVANMSADLTSVAGQYELVVTIPHGWSAFLPPAPAPVDFPELL